MLGIGRHLMKLPRRLITIALAFVLAVGVLTLAEDAATIRINQTNFYAAGAPSIWYSVPKIAFPGELIEVEFGEDWTVPISSDPSVLVPLQASAGYGYFVAARPGEATLHAGTTPRCTRCQQADVLWRMTVEVRIPGT